MSLETWKAEFYPVDADKVSEADALDHSLRKWIGLKSENLKKHDVVPHDGSGTLNDSCTLYDAQDRTLTFFVNYRSCALCHHYTQEEAGDPCATCPISLSRDGISCDNSTEMEFGLSPYAVWTYVHTPHQMIEVLIEAKKYVNQGNQNETV